MSEETDKSRRVGWRHEWGTLALLWAMVLWLVITIASGPFTVADMIVIVCVLAGGAVGSLVIVDASKIPMRTRAEPGTAVPAEAEATEPEPSEESAADTEAEPEPAAEDS